MKRAKGNRYYLLIVTTYNKGLSFKNQLKVEGDVAVEISYYNECLAAWEPLLEPVMIEQEKTMWEVQIKVTDIILFDKSYKNSKNLKL